MEQLRYYFNVGGMPEEVKIFIETLSLTEITAVHKSLSQSCLQDFAKYLNLIEKKLSVKIPKGRCPPSGLGDHALRMFIALYHLAL